MNVFKVLFLFGISRFGQDTDNDILLNLNAYYTARKVEQNKVPY